MSERTEYVVNTEGMTVASRVAACRKVLSVTQSDAARFETDLPCTMAAEWPAEVRRAAEKLQTLRKSKRSGGHAHEATGIQEKRDLDVWEAFITFAPYAFDASVWSPHAGSPLVSLADCSGSIVARLTIAQTSLVAEKVGRDALVPMREWRHRR